MLKSNLYIFLATGRAAAVLRMTIILVMLMAALVFASTASAGAIPGTVGS